MVLANWARDPRPSEFDAEISLEIDRVKQAIRDKDDRWIEEVWRPAGLPQADRRAEGPPPILESRNDDPRLRDMALETAPWRRILNADRRASVLIGECTSDNGVHVHRNAISMCAPALPYVAACLTVAARPPELRRRSGAFGRRRERPPLSGCLDRHRGGLACARPCHPPPGVAPLQQSLAGRPSSAAASAAYQRIRPPVAAFHQLGGSASRPSEVGVGARPSPKLPRGG